MHIEKATRKREIVTSISLRDVITMLTAAIAIAAAFFMYDRRIAVLEEIRVRDEQQITQLDSQVKQDENQRFQDRQSVQTEIDEMKTDIAVNKVNSEVALHLRKKAQ